MKEHVFHILHRLSISFTANNLLVKYNISHIATEMPQQNPSIEEQFRTQHCACDLFVFTHLHHPALIAECPELIRVRHTDLVQGRQVTGEVSSRVLCRVWKLRNILQQNRRQQI